MDATKIIMICLLCFLALESIAARPSRKKRDVEEIDIDTETGRVSTFEAADDAEGFDDVVGTNVRDGPVLSRRRRSTIAFMMDAYRRHCLHNPESCRASRSRSRSRQRQRYRSRRRHGFLIIDM